MNLRRSTFGRPVRLVRVGDAIEPAAPPVDVPITDRTADLLEMVMPVVRAVVDPSTTQSVAVLKAKIANQQALARKVGEPLRTLYLNNVGVLQAKLKVAVERERRDAKTRASATEWAFLGKAFTGTGILLGAAGIYVLISVGRHYQRKGRVE